MRKALLDMVPSALLAVDYLFSRPDVDTTRLVILGYSFGAPFLNPGGILRFLLNFGSSACHRGSRQASSGGSDGIRRWGINFDDSP